jgi:hypothetical protein
VAHDFLAEALSKLPPHQVSEDIEEGEVELPEVDLPDTDDGSGTAFCVPLDEPDEHEPHLPDAEPKLKKWWKSGLDFVKKSLGGGSKG